MMMDFASSGESRMKANASIDADVQVASVGAMSSSSFTSRHSKKDSSKGGSIRSLVGFSSLLKSDISNNLGSTGDGDGSVSTPVEERKYKQFFL
jgi:hypothetical protein